MTGIRFPQVVLESLSPDAQARDGSGQIIRYAVVPGPMGACFMACAGESIVYLGFPGEGQGQSLAAQLQQDWPYARIFEDTTALASHVRRVFRPGFRDSVHVLVKGTPFQLAIWEALIAVPPGSTTTYGAIAGQIGRPRALRAAGTAVGKNPVSYLIPCHRVLPAGGGLGGYLWGQDCKRRLLEREGYPVSPV